MPDTFSFASVTPRFGLPNLFAAQAQKEFTVNEAFALLDALLHAAVEGIANDPPQAPNEGECWIIGNTPTAEWATQAGEIACYQAGNWLFASPAQGMTVFDRANSCIVRYLGEWVGGAAISQPAGGETIDSEARTAIAAIIDALSRIGILPGA